MKLSEKTLELNICAQWTSLPPWAPCLWFGLTQLQEARAGFDVCSRIGAKLLILQFKASNHFVRKVRRFHAPHRQLQALQNNVRISARQIFYVLPDLGSTVDLAASPKVLGRTWLLDVAQIPKPMPAPMTSWGTLRKSGIHYIDIHPGTSPPHATMYLEPHDVPIISVLQLIEA